MLHSEDLAVRQQAGSEFFRIGNTPEGKRRAVRALIEILEEPGVHYRTWYDAAGLLITWADGETIPILASHIGYSEGSAEFRNESFNIAHALGQMGEAALDDLIAALSSGNAAARERAAYALGINGEEKADRALRRARPLEQETRVVSSIDDALRLVEKKQALRRETTEPPAVARHCLSSDSGFMATPIKTIFLNGRPTSVDETLCHVDDALGSASDPGDWWLVSKTSAEAQATHIGKNGFWGYSVAAVLPSPDGKYLAVLSSAEGAPFIQVVELAAFVRNKTMKPVRDLEVGLGLHALKGWNGDTLQVASSLFIGQRHLELLGSGEEVFSWDVRTGAVVPQSAALRDPVRYYCGFLGANDLYTRSTAALGLRVLRDRSSAPCIEAALARSPDDAELQLTLRLVLGQISEPSSQGWFLTISGGKGADRRLALFRDVGSLEWASIAIPSDLTAESIEFGLKNVVWDRGERSVAAAFERGQSSFVVAFLDNRSSAYTASDISRSELNNPGAVGSNRVYAALKTRPVEWQTGKEGQRILRIRTEAWDASGKRYSAEGHLAFDDSGRPDRR